MKIVTCSSCWRLRWSLLEPFNVYKSVFYEYGCYYDPPTILKKRGFIHFASLKSPDVFMSRVRVIIYLFGCGSFWLLHFLRLCLAHSVSVYSTKVYIYCKMKATSSRLRAQNVSLLHEEFKGHGDCQGRQGLPRKHEEPTCCTPEGISYTIVHPIYVFTVYVRATAYANKGIFFVYLVQGTCVSR